MTTSRSALGGIAFTLAFLGISIAPGRAEEAVDSVPRYELTPGQELSYRSQSEFKYKDGSFGNKADWQVWVLRKNEDGSFRMLFRSSERTVQSSSGREAREQPADVSMGYADLFPDGRFVPNDSWGYRLNPTPLFPKLPADVGELKSGWTGTNPRDDSRTAYQVASPADEGPTGWLFEGVRTTPLDKIYMFTDRSKNHFDRKKGLVTRIENENSQGYGFEGKGSGTTELTAIERRDDVWVKSLAEESDVYFAATKACGDLQKKASHDPAQAETLLAQAETTLKAAREKVRLPILRTQFDEQLKMQKATAKYYTSEAKERAEVLGREAADWQTTDLEGKAHALKDYRGKVVLLDFWYRGCGWCIRAMPQVVQLADDFKDEPVAILGMNTDRNEADAKFVVDAMKLNYPVLKAEGLPEKYHVRGFPTLIIIDPQGKVADVHIGYSPTLRDEVAKSVKAILAKK